MYAAVSEYLLVIIIIIIPINISNKVVYRTIDTIRNRIELKKATLKPTKSLDSWLQHVCDRPLNNTNIIISAINFNINMD